MAITVYSTSPMLKIDAISTILAAPAPMAPLWNSCQSASPKASAWKGDAPMSTGWLTWACLMLAAGAPGDADEIVHINQRGFQIPIKVLPGRQHEVRELLLYLSRDQGRTRQIHARSLPDKK